jgi:hypothetical protein
MASTIGPHDQYALISPQAFTDRMDIHWSQKLELASSQALKDLWATMASTFRTSIINSINGVVDAPWLILQPPTGSGKTQGACVFAAMQAEANAKALLKPVGVLIVTRLIEQADTLAKDVNELAGRVVAIAHHSKRPATSQEMLDSDILIITHQAYVNAAEYLGSPKNAPHFVTWRVGRRLLTIIDEALANVVEDIEVTMADLALVLSFITPGMGNAFPEQLLLLEELRRVLAKYADPEKRTDNRATRMLWGNEKTTTKPIPDMTPLRSAMKRLQYDALVLGESHSGSRERVAEKVDATLRASQVVTERWAYHSQKGTEHTINSSSFLLPLDIPGPVVLDATAHTNFMWDLFGPKAEIVATPPRVRDYSAVRLHIARDGGLGKGSMIEHAKTRVPRLLDALRLEVGTDASVFMCMHRDAKHVAVSYANPFARFDVGHWGAIDGRNDWSDYDTAVIFGLHYLDRVWSTNQFFALRGPQDDYWLQNPDWNEHDDVRQVMEQRQLSVSIIQAINRVRCRRVIDAQGRSPPADIYVILPKNKMGDAILQDIRVDMPGIVEVPWAFELDGPVVPVVRKGSSHEALIAFMTTRPPGETTMITVKAELDLKDRALKKLKEILRAADHPTTTRLRDMGVRYVVIGKGRGAKSYLTKDRAA